MIMLMKDDILKWTASLSLFAFTVFLFSASVYLFKSYKFMGAGLEPGATIVVVGEGKLEAKPDLARLSFSVKKEGKDKAALQNDLAKRVKKIMEFLKNEGIDKSDIKTQSISLYPKYYWRNGQRKEDGYMLSQGFEIIIRDLSKANKIVSRLGALGADNISSLRFEFKSEKELKKKARSKAIQDAKFKAKELAKELGVELVRIVEFSENTNYLRPYPIYKAAAAKSLDSELEGIADTEIPTGKKEVKSTVTIKYEIQ